MRNKPTIRVFEEYYTPRAKKTAQVGAVRGQPTGKTNSFIFVLPTEAGDYNTWAKGGETFPATPDNMIDTAVSPAFLRKWCRRVGKKYLPKEWVEYSKTLS